MSSQLSKNIEKIINDFSNDLQSRQSAISNDEVLLDLILECTSVSKSEYSRRVILTGVGKNANLATKASETFASLGIPSLYCNTTHMIHGDFGFCGPEDLVVHLSRSGKTEEMILAAQQLKRIRPYVKQYLISCNEPGSLSHLHDLFDIIYLGKVIEFDEHHLAPTTSTLLMLLVLDIVGVEVSKRINFSRSDFLDLHPGGALGQMLRDEQTLKTN